jgi:CelD/BcsL family acetyltransferase involved in cellulose biosynthesis
MDLVNCPEDPAEIFNGTRRNERNRWQKAGAHFIEITEADKIHTFNQLLIDNLKKHEAVPIHSYDNFIDFKFKRLSEETMFYGTYLNDEMVAGCLLFKFLKSKTLHLQYFATHQKLEGGLPSPAAFTYYSIIKTAREQGFTKVSWGTSTFNLGRILNGNLLKFKESISNQYSQNKIYHWKRGIENGNVK